MTHASLPERLGLACGIIGPLWWGVMIAWCASRFPGYSHVTDFISELAARDAPTADLMRVAGFYVTGLLYLLFAAAAAWRLRARPLALAGVALVALSGAARIGTGYFPCEPGCDPSIISRAQEWHHAYARAGYAAMMLAALFVGIGVRRERALAHLFAGGIGVAIWTLVVLFYMQFSEERAGLFQRLASVLLSGWVLVFAVSLWCAATATPGAATASPARRSRA
ncbi:MAG: DUF998 domain-containing protein [Gammaproteobacteria bacterium]